MLRKREHYRKVYDGFDPQKIARYTPAKLAKLLADPGIIRHRGKIDASVSNARAYLEIVEREGSFSKFLWSVVDGKPRKNRPKTLKGVPAKTPESDALSRSWRRPASSSWAPPSVTPSCKPRAWSTTMSRAAIAARSEF